MQKQLHSVIRYRSSIFTLSEDRVPIENGSVVTRSIVHHNGGSAILVQKEGRVLLVRQYRYALRQDLLEIPAGKIENGEDPSATALRELEEETGWSCRQLKPILTMCSTPGFCDEQIHIFEALDLCRPLQRRPMDDDECIELQWIPLQEAYAMIRDGSITDAKTIIALQYAMLNEAQC